jgi:SpoVK/Ycf46/Vps4 family AAA+-type ATPase
MRGEVLKRLFRALASEDPRAINNILSSVVEEERRIGHGILADQLDNILRKGNHSTKSKSSFTSPHGGDSDLGIAESRSRAVETRPLTQLSSRHRFNHPFIVSVPHGSLRHEMILSDAVETRFRRIEQEYAARDRLAHHGLRYRQKIILYGSPGCGKTMGAERIAWNTGLAFVKIRFDAMVSSYLGETATNLREVFEKAITSPCLLFIDECDALAKSRGDSQEIGEIKRVVNTFLQLLDEYEVSNGLLVAATNLTRFLDEAVWRRFDDAIEVPKPAEPEVEAILQQSLSSVEAGSIDWSSIIHKMIGFSAAQVTKVAQDAAKRAILDREELVIQEHLEEAIKEIKISNE